MKTKKFSQQFFLIRPKCHPIMVEIDLKNDSFAQHTWYGEREGDADEGNCENYSGILADSKGKTHLALAGSSGPAVCKW